MGVFGEPIAGTLRNKPRTKIGLWREAELKRREENTVRAIRLGRWLVMIAVLAIVAAACKPRRSHYYRSGTSTRAHRLPRHSEVAIHTTVRGTSQTGGEIATYRLGTFSDTTTDNFWAYLDPAATVWNQYVLTPTKPTLYTINYPGLGTRC